MVSLYPNPAELKQARAAMVTYARLFPNKRKWLGADKNRVGSLPGMTAVLHAWGSDLKQHLHIHCLITFGGLD